MATKDAETLYLALKQGKMASLATAITVIESESSQDQVVAAQILKKIFENPQPETLRIGISGAPGVGKSTFINRLGVLLVQRGYKVAVLAIDPSSEISLGSILGDKTRMEELSREPQAYIRPSSSRGFLGGVHPSTRDTIRLCEAAGYDIVLVETVGVGQSETAVADLVDYFLLITAPGAGDELQGIKKGLLEKIDAVIVNKADSQQKIAAEITEKQIQSALSILRQTKVPTQRVSSLEQVGFDATADLLMQFWMKNKSGFTQKRRLQDASWLGKHIQALALMELKEKLLSSEIFKLRQAEVEQGQLDVRAAAVAVLRSL